MVSGGLLFDNPVLEQSTSDLEATKTTDLYSDTNILKGQVRTCYGNVLYTTVVHFTYYRLLLCTWNVIGFFIVYKIENTMNHSFICGKPLYNKQTIFYFLNFLFWFNFIIIIIIMLSTVINICKLYEFFKKNHAFSDIIFIFLENMKCIKFVDLQLNIFLLKTF